MRFYCSGLLFCQRFHGTGRAFNASPMAFLVTGTDFYSSVYKHLLQELSTEWYLQLISSCLLALGLPMASNPMFLHECSSPCLCLISSKHGASTETLVFLMLLWCGCLCVAHSATFVDDCQLTTNFAEFFGAVLYLFFWCCLITYLNCFMLLCLQLVSEATALQMLSTMERNAQVNGGWMSGLFHFCQHESI